jgi:hypothetical protein
MLPLSTTLIGTDVPRANCTPKKIPKTTPTIRRITSADLKYSFRRILVKTLNLLPSTINLRQKENTPNKPDSFDEDSKQKIGLNHAFILTVA